MLKLISFLRKPLTWIQIMAAETGKGGGRDPHAWGEAGRPAPVKPVNNGSCLSSIFSSCISASENAEDNCCCACLKSLGDIVWSALSSCWSAIASIFANIFGSPTSSEGLTTSSEDATIQGI